MSKSLKGIIIVDPTAAITDSIGEATFKLSKNGKKKGTGKINFKAGLVSKSVKVKVK